MNAFEANQFNKIQWPQPGFQLRTPGLVSNTVSINQLDSTTINALKVFMVPLEELENFGWVTKANIGFRRSNTLGNY